MSKFEIMKEFTFSAAHRLKDHGGKCKSIHGHNYKCQVWASAERLGDDGMVADFNVLTGIINGQIMPKLDHVTILESDDPLLQVLTDAEDKVPETLFYVTVYPPTAEYLAKTILGLFRNQISKPVNIDKVVLWETDTCCATAS